MLGCRIFWIAADLFQHRVAADAVVPIMTIADVAFVSVHDAVPVTAGGRGDLLGDLVAIFQETVFQVERGPDETSVVGRDNRGRGEQFSRRNLVQFLFRGVREEPAEGVVHDGKIYRGGAGIANRPGLELNRAGSLV